MQSLPRIFASLVVVVVSCCLACAEEPIRYADQIQPLLAERCFRCHGPDDQTRESGLRLDVRDRATKALESGATAIVPSKPAASELLARVASDDEDVRMPPSDAGKPLTGEEIELLRKWIAAGATYQQHWSFEVPQRPQPPAVPNDQWSQSLIDPFVLKRLRDLEWTPAPEAPPAVLCRRVTLALTGLPPTPEEVRAFVADSSPNKYEQLVDRLLASPAFGERWGAIWLDLARYADSAGYAQDPARTIWRFRDWVIQAFNQNHPFDQFTTEQLAGDMLPDATDWQKIATAFHRNTMTNSEGGTDDEEFRSAAVVDRVNTTLQVWMGLTMGCAQCHTHKYDPITQKEYFQMYAVFNNTADADRGDESPLLSTFPVRTAAHRERLQQQLESLTKTLPASDTAKPPAGPLQTKTVRIELAGKKAFLSLAEVTVKVGDENVALKGEAKQISTDYEGAAKLAIDGNTNGDYFTAKSTTHTSAADNPWWEVTLPEAVVVDEVAVWNRTDGAVGSRLSNFRIVGLNEQRQPLWIRAIAKAPSPSAAVKPPQDGAKLKPDELKLIAEYQGGGEHPEITKLKAEIAKLKPVTTPVMQELPKDKRRATHIQIRGNFLEKDEEVSPGVPAAFHPLPAGAEANRLTVARWIVSAENPLAARVAVNRVWEQLFGIGLVETSEDFGVQGEKPSHPDLLDFLAVEFRSGGWDVKRLMRDIVLSSTYRQSTVVEPHVEREDPRNRWLARGPRFRMPAEMIRDQALAVSELLCRDMNGPSVRPPRPKLGLRAAFGGSTDWDPSPGGDRFRRGLYTSWRRTTPYPSMTTFDAPSREVCTIRRVRTNTPLQALVTLNDPVFVEAAQALARAAIASSDDDAERAAWAFRRCLSREPSTEENKRLLELLAKVRGSFQPSQATQLATVPLGPLPAGVSAEEAATWTVVSNVLMNLDEFLAPR